MASCSQLNPLSWDFEFVLPSATSTNQITLFATNPIFSCPNNMMVFTIQFGPSLAPAHIIVTSFVFTRPSDIWIPFLQETSNVTLPVNTPIFFDLCAASGKYILSVYRQSVQTTNLIRSFNLSAIGSPELALSSFISDPNTLVHAGTSMQPHCQTGLSFGASLGTSTGKRSCCC